MHFRFQALALGVSLFLGGAGCQPESPDEAAREAPVAVKQGMRVANSLTTQALVLNAISTNPTASPLLVGSSGLASLFNPSSGNSYLQLQLRDVDAQHFMSYLVGCALEPGHSVSWKDPLTLTVQTWPGLAGLCPQWETGAPSQACKNRVSACLLARNNAYGRRVELSMRGEDPSRPALFQLETQTRPVEIDPDTASRVPSYEPCTTAQTGMNRDCGWKADFIGRCTPGQTVRLGAGGKAPDQCTSSSASALGSASGARMMLRVCDNTLGCDQGSTRQLAQSQGTCATTAPAVSFTCPASSFFNVMAAPYDSTLVGAVSVGVETSTPANTRYRLSEAEVYPVREGAYYGNIFDAAALATKVYVDESGRVQGKEAVVQGPIYRKMFSCQAPEWNDALAYATYRMCALPDSGANCAARSTGVCVDWTNRSFPASKCTKDDGAVVNGDGDFEDCYDSYGGQWREPVTVYLHETCGMPGIPSDYCATSRGTTK